MDGEYYAFTYLISPANVSEGIPDMICNNNAHTEKLEEELGIEQKVITLDDLMRFIEKGYYAVYATDVHMRGNPNDKLLVAFCSDKAYAKTFEDMYCGCVKIEQKDKEGLINLIRQEQF